MKKRDFKPIGSDTYATVYKNTKDVVIKAFTDPFYLEFVKRCAQLHNNPYVPVFRGKPIHLFGNGNAATYVVRTELLKRASAETSYLLRYYIAYRLYDKYVNVRLDEAGDQPVTDSSFDKDKRDAFKKYSKDVHLDALVALLISITKSNKSLYIDLGDDNVMSRGKQLVVTDPVASLNRRG